MVTGQDSKGGSQYYHDKGYTILDKKIFFEEKRYQPTNNSLKLKIEALPYLIGKPRSFQDTVAFTNASFGSGLGFNYQVDKGRELILLVLGASSTNILLYRDEKGHVANYVDTERVDLNERRFVIERKYNPEFQTLGLVKRYEVAIR